MPLFYYWNKTYLRSLKTNLDFCLKVQFAVYYNQIVIVDMKTRLFLFFGIFQLPMVKLWCALASYCWCFFFLGFCVDVRNSCTAYTFCINGDGDTLARGKMVLYLLGTSHKSDFSLLDFLQYIKKKFLHASRFISSCPSKFI